MAHSHSRRPLHCPRRASSRTFLLFAVLALLAGVSAPFIADGEAAATSSSSLGLRHITSVAYYMTPVTWRLGVGSLLFPAVLPRHTNGGAHRGCRLLFGDGRSTGFVLRGPLQHGGFRGHRSSVRLHLASSPRRGLPEKCLVRSARIVHQPRRRTAHSPQKHPADQTHDRHHAVRCVRCPQNMLQPRPHAARFSLCHGSPHDTGAGHARASSAHHG